jgi:hypothetical protein
VASYTTREISEKLRRYASFLESEIARYTAIDDFSEDRQDFRRTLEQELTETREMQSYF